MRVRSGFRAAVLRAQPRSALAGTNMSTSQSPPGKLMAARDNPTVTAQMMKGGPHEQDRDIPTGGNSPNLGRSQPTGGATNELLPLKHWNAQQRRRR